MLKVENISEFKVKVRIGESNFIFETWEFEDKKILVEMLIQCGVGFTQEKAEKIAVNLHTLYDLYPKRIELFNKRTNLNKELSNIESEINTIITKIISLEDMLEKTKIVTY